MDIENTNDIHFSGAQFGSAFLLGGGEVMRQFWMGFFLAGLFAMGWSVHERRQTGSTPSNAGVAGSYTGVAASVAEDGTGFPHPYPTPTPRP